MTHTMCSSVSVVNILLQRYLQVSFLYVAAASWPVFFTGRSSANTADTYSHAIDSVRGTDNLR